MGANSWAGIACGGVWTVDLVKVIDAYPCENTISYISTEFMAGGGCAHNVTLNLAKFDDCLAIHAVGIVGNDALGDFLINECRQFPHINIDQLRRTDLEKTSYTDVFSVKSTSRRTFFHYRGANRLFSPEHVDLENLRVNIFHLGYLLMLDAMDQPDAEFGTVAARLLAQIRSRNIRTSIDLVSEDSSRFARIVPPALKYTDYCIINDFEAAKLSGVPIRTGDRLLSQNLRTIATAILTCGVRDLVVIHFPEGAYLRSRGGVELLQPALDLPESFIVGSTGAGDSFCAGMLYGLLRGWDHAKALRFAVCAGGMNLSDMTTTGGIKSWREVFQMEERFPYRGSVG
jgi:sugar/nucleoside kinase (ribokinase family)